MSSVQVSWFLVWAERSVSSSFEFFTNVVSAV